MKKWGLTPFLCLLLSACAHGVSPEGAAFGVLGDTPYSEAEIARLEGLIDEMNAQPLAFVAHVGDVGSSRRACTDEWLQERRKQFARIRHPFVLIPGDNEWSNCRDPLARLQRWRSLFCHGTLRAEVQAGEYCEHLRWEAAGHVFVTLNVPGHDNNAGHAEHAPRMRAVLSWLDEAAALAARRDLGLVVLMQANPFLPRGFGSLLEQLGRLAARRPGKILLIHGDTHIYRNDEPLPGLRRIEVWGSPIVAWHRLAFSELRSR
jgi:hypothetical protein